MWFLLSVSFVVFVVYSILGHFQQFEKYFCHHCP